MTGAYAAHLVPSEPGWLDLALRTPLMSSERARRELGWEPGATAVEALLELLEGTADGADGPTPPLSARAGGPARVGEVAGGMGEREA